MKTNTAIVRKWLREQYHEKAPIYRGLMPVIPLSVLMDLISHWQKNNMMFRSALKELISYWEKHNMIQFTKSTLMTGSFSVSEDIGDYSMIIHYGGDFPDILAEKYPRCMFIHIDECLAFANKGRTQL